MSYASFWRSAFKAKGVRWIAAGWTAFIAENVVLSHNREWLIERLGGPAALHGPAGSERCDMQTPVPSIVVGGQSSPLPVFVCLAYESGIWHLY